VLKIRTQGYFFGTVADISGMAGRGQRKRKKGGWRERTDSESRSVGAGFQDPAKGQRFDSVVVGGGFREKNPVLTKGARTTKKKQRFRKE